MPTNIGGYATILLSSKFLTSIPLICFSVCISICDSVHFEFNGNQVNSERESSAHDDYAALAARRF